MKIGCDKLENKFYGFISKSNERYETWCYIMGNDNPEVVLIGPKPIGVYGPKTREGCSNGLLLYAGDPKALTKEQRERFIEKMVEKFPVTKEEVEANLKDGKFPVACDGWRGPAHLF